MISRLLSTTSSYIVRQSHTASSMLLYMMLEVAIVALLTTGSAAAGSTCYYPNGEKNNGGACRESADVSSCCGPTFICLGNGLCQPGPDTTRTYAYNYYRSGCTDANFTSTSCPQICIGSGYHNDRGQGVKSCGNDTYCCGTSGDCCRDASSVFALQGADVVATISASSAYITDPANNTPADTLTSGKNSRALAIGLGVGIGVGALLLVTLGVLFVLKRKRKTRHRAEYKKTEEISELDAPWKAELPLSTDVLPPIKVSHRVTGGGVLHEIGEGNSCAPAPPQELEANYAYDWEPRNEPEPRDGGFRPLEQSEHRTN